MESLCCDPHQPSFLLRRVGASHLADVYILRVFYQPQSSQSQRRNFSSDPVDLVSSFDICTGKTGPLERTVGFLRKRLEVCILEHIAQFCQLVTDTTLDVAACGLGRDVVHGKMTNM